MAASPCESPTQPLPPQTVKTCAAAMAALTGDGGLAAPVEAAVQGALTGILRQVGLPGASGRLTAIVAPVRSHEGQILGVSIVLFSGNPTTANATELEKLRGFVSELLRRLGPAALYFLLLATVIGTLSGVLISRNLTRRLRRITLAANAWSKGELSHEIRDHSADEPGQLQTQLDTKRELAIEEGGFAVVGEAGSGGEAVLMAADLAPDVVLMDLVMPELDGVEATRLLKQRSPRSQVIVLTSYHEDEHIFPAIRAGALSYLLKGAGLEELTEAVRKAARGEAVLHPHVAARLVQEIKGALPETALLYETLSAREREVLKLIASGLHNAEIAERLVISERTVKSHVNNILSKLHVADRTRAAVFAWREGIMRNH